MNDLLSLFERPGQETRHLSAYETETYLDLLNVERHRGTIRQQYEAVMPGGAIDDLPFAVRVAIARIDTFAPDLDREEMFDFRMICLAAALADTPADVVMWVYSLVKETRKTNSVVSIDEFHEHFPEGVPSMPTRKKMWFEQKVGNHNFLDEAAAYAA